MGTPLGVDKLTKWNYYLAEKEVHSKMFLFWALSNPFYLRCEVISARSRFPRGCAKPYGVLGGGSANRLFDQFFFSRNCMKMKIFWTGPHLDPPMVKVHSTSELNCLMSDKIRQTRQSFQKSKFLILIGETISTFVHSTFKFFEVEQKRQARRYFQKNGFGNISMVGLVVSIA